MRNGLTILVALLLVSCGAFQIKIRVNPLPAKSPTPTYASPLPTRTALPSASPTILPSPTTRPTASVSPGYLRPTNTLSRTQTLVPLIPPLVPGQPVALASLDMLGTTGWGLESSGRIVRSVDGGKSWRDVTPAQGSGYTAGSFYAPDPNFAWAANTTPQGAMVWYTQSYQDRGRTWIQSGSIDLRAVDGGMCGPLKFAEGMTFITQLNFIDSLTGWLAGYAQAEKDGQVTTVWLLYSSSDKGRHWDLRTLSTLDCSTGGAPDGLRSVYFTGPTTGWGGFFSTKWNDPRFNQPRYVGGWDLYWTGDGGRTWEAQKLPDPPGFLEQVSKTEYAKNNAECGVDRIVPLAHDIFGLSLTCFIYSGVIQEYDYYYLTFDGGANWRAWRATGDETFFVDVYSGNKTTGWRLLSSASDSLSQIQQTADGGQTWLTIKYVAWQSATFDFVSANEGWALVTSGTESAFVHTIDGGKTWSSIKPVVAGP